MQTERGLPSASSSSRPRSPGNQGVNGGIVGWKRRQNGKSLSFTSRDHYHPFPLGPDPPETIGIEGQKTIGSAQVDEKRAYPYPDSTPGSCSSVEPGGGARQRPFARSLNLSTAPILRDCPWPIPDFLLSTACHPRPDPDVQMQTSTCPFKQREATSRIR